MGQGYSLTTLSAGAAGIDVPELADLSYEKSLGGARFMKTIRARHKDGLVVAKVVMKPYASMKLDHYVKAILDERTALADVPNVLGYHRVVETSTNGYLVRQFVHSSLYDRMSTRPFLEDIEKKWLAFQLLCAVRDCHARNIFHGDIKTENTLVTSWNWLYLSDFSSSFKPTYLPEDNPADFSFYFDTSARRTCYVAPERFLSAGQQAEGKDRINWAMDIFSVGCVIAELFLEGPIFSLSQLFKYRKGEYDPEHAHLSKIEDKEIRELVTHMIQVDPESRFSADEYLQFWRRRAFPDYFYSFLHQYMHLITDPTSGRKQVTAGQVNLGESDDRIDRIYYDFDKISFFLGYNSAKLTDMQKAHRRSTSQLFPLYLDIPNNRHQASAMRNRSVDDGTLLFLTLTVTSVRSTARATARLRACELLLAFSERLTDEAKLDRVLPYVMTLLQDPTEIVRVTALRTLTQLLALVSVVSPINAYVFPEYILPKLQVFVPGSKENPSPLSRMTYASCLASLASTASRFLDMMQALRADGSLPTTDPEAEDDVTSYSAYRTLYDIAREDLVFQFEAQTKAFLTDMDSANEEDEQWLTRLRNIGMGPGDEFKLLALREYIWRVAHRQNKGASERTSSRFGQKSVLNELGISPQTVFFDSGEQFFDKVISHDSIPHHEQIKSPHAAQHTIADALLDASTPVDDAVARRGRSHPHSQKVKDLDRMLFGDEAMRSKGPILNALPPPLASPGPDRDSNAEPHSKSLQVPRPRGGVPKTDGDLSSSLDSNNDPKSDHRVRHQTSAMNLMNSTEARKANAETSTDPTNAVGKLNIPSLQTTSNSVNEPLVSSINPPQVSPRFRNAHTYTGHDPTVLKMLDDLYAGTYPVDAVEFGPTVAQRSHRHPVKRAYPSANMWRPEGLRVAVLNEHSGPCTRIAVAPDHVFFITASDDGTIKVWDTARLEKNIMHRPRCTYKLPAGARVSSVCFVEKTHTFISTGTDGSVNVAKVDVVETGGTARYGKLKILREWRFPTEGEHAVWSEHFKSDTESVLIMATNESRIVAIALRTMSIMYELENPAHHGTPTCFCLDRKGHWLLLGTSHGVLDLWDLRFQKRLKGWGFKSAVPVKRVMLHPLPLKEKKGDSHEVGTRQQIIMAGGTDKNEVTVWDLERMTCREVYRTTSTDSPAQHGSSGAGAKSLRDYEALDLDVERKDGMLGRFGTSVEPEMLPDGGRVAFSGLAVGIQGLLPAADEDAEAKLLFLLTAGPDWKIRFWDCWKAQGSQIVSGVEQGDSRPTYSCTRLGNGLKVFQELRSEPVSQERKKSGRDSKASRYDVIRTHQQHLSCRGHRDEVLDVALLEYPFGMIVSADRSGTIMVYK